MAASSHSTLRAFRRRDAGQDIVHLKPVHDKFDAELKNVRGFLGGMFLVLLSGRRTSRKSTPLTARHLVRMPRNVLQNRIGPGN